MNRPNAALARPPAEGAAMTEAALEQHLLHLLRRFGLVAGLALVRPVAAGVAADVARPGQRAQDHDMAIVHGRYRDVPGKDLANIRRPGWGASA